MSYNRTGKPVFYIDHYLYYKTIGAQLISSTYNGSNNYISPDVMPDLYTLEPSFPKQLTESQNDISIPMPSSILDYDFSGNMKWYFAVLNHTGLSDFSINMHGSDGSITTLSDGLEEVLNGGWDGASFQTLSGSTVITYSNNLPSNNPVFHISGSNVGSISTGVQYTMPYSPDLSLTSSVEFDGVQSKRSMGGYEITNINYTGNPLWHNNGNVSNPFDVWDSDVDAVYNTLDKGIVRNGRKNWQLSFSYLADKDLFSSNQKGSYYTEHSSDSPEVLALTYESSDINNNELIDNVMTDDSFYSQVWNKTLGGALPFIFQPNENNRDDFYICKFKTKTLSASQVAYRTYNISIEITEAW